MKIAAVIVVLGCMAAPAFGQSNEYNGPTRKRAAQTTDQIIVKWRSEASATTSAAAASRLAKLASSAGLRLQLKQQITVNTDVLQLDRRLNAAELDAVLARIAAEPEIEYAAPNLRRFPHVLPTDPLIAEQWYFLSTETSATRAEQAWDITTGSNSTVVAVLDTGVRFEHPDLLGLAQGGKLLPGFDFVADAAVANDGDARDGDSSDPGDWIDTADRTQPGFGECELSDSSWHGTRVASLIGALTNNAIGMAGSGWNTVLLPVRVLGKCGGVDSDIIEAMRWAAGLSVIGVPANPNPAQIINLSLGGEGACSAAYQTTLDEISARGVLVIVSAGNDGGPVSAPANCTGVLAVAGLRHAGTKVGFSNLGTEVVIAAPAGNCVNTEVGQPCLFSILVATNTGATTPATSSYTDQFNFNVGTSFSAPLVAGAAALMHSVNTQLSPTQYVTLLQESAATFPTSSTTSTTTCHVPTSPNDLQTTECICTTQTCGAGVLNTHAAVLAAQQPLAVAQAPGVIDPGANVTLDGRTSFASNNRSISAYQWSVLNVTGAIPAIADPSAALTTLQVSGSSEFTLRLTVTDDTGAQDNVDVAMVTTAAPNAPVSPSPDPPPSSGGGGGGGFGWLMLGLFGLRALAHRLVDRARP